MDHQPSSCVEYGLNPIVVLEYGNVWNMVVCGIWWCVEYGGVWNRWCAEYGSVQNMVVCGIW